MDSTGRTGTLNLYLYTYKTVMNWCKRKGPCIHSATKKTLKCKSTLVHTYILITQITYSYMTVSCVVALLIYM